MKKPSGPKMRKKGPAAPLPPKLLHPRTQNAFPIVGIGASAGGLEALELFLKHVPAGSGMAFVIVQHLDPTHKGIMVELLQRTTPMPVVQAKDRLKVAPECVYVIPPNKDMSILHGVLHLLEPAAPRGLRLPIDFFFRSLADDRRDLSVGVILSGMGSDGTLGLRAIKEKAGVVFVQALLSAKFDGMPRSAIAAGLADVVAPAEELPRRIIAYLKHAPLIATPDPSRESKTQSALEKVFILLRTQTGQDFSLYKKRTIYRRVERRMGLHQIDKLATYVRFLRENPQEIELLFKELLIGVTSFFRDPPAWEQLKDDVIPALLAAYPKGGVLRVWASGCSTGEEAYSLAMVFKEALERVKPAGNVSLQVFATDLDRDAIDRAREGVYPANIAADISPERLRRFFVQDEHGGRAGKEIREAVVFAPQNVIMDPPFTKLDLLICRNLLIYLDPGIQKKTHTPLSLQPESQRCPVSGQRRDHRRLYRSFCPTYRQDAVIPAARLRPGGRAGRIPLLVFFRSAACCCRSAPGADARPQPPGIRGSTALAALLPGSRADERQGGYPLYQRAHGQISGAGGGQGQLEHLRHGARRAALRVEQHLSKSAAAESRGPPHGRESGDQRRGAGRGYHRSAGLRACGPAGDGDDRLYGGGYTL